VGVAVLLYKIWQKVKLLTVRLFGLNNPCTFVGVVVLSKQLPNRDVVTELHCSIEGGRLHPPGSGPSLTGTLLPVFGEIGASISPAESALVLTV
jgi:hypothetical protein